MALASCYTKISSNNAQEIHDQGRNVTGATRKLLGANIAGRRQILLSFPTSTILAVAATDQTNDSRTALLQKYLKKSEENKVKNDKERLDNYYKRNYKDYFGFVEGTLRAKEDQQLSESEKGILEWLDKNK